MIDIENYNDPNQLELFTALDKPLKPRAVQDVMLFPYFSLAKRRRFTPIKYESANGDIQIKVSGNTEDGIASIYDADYLFWAVPQVRRAYEKTGKDCRTFYFVPKQMLRNMGKKVGSENYRQLERALGRLQTTGVKTTVRSEHITSKQGFSWLDHWTTSEQRKSGEPLGMWSMTLSNWLYQGIIDESNLLGLSREYYQLESGLTKRLYLIARKHAGIGAYGFTLSMRQLYEQSGSEEEYKHFAKKVRLLYKNNLPLIDYAVLIARDEDNTERVTFIQRSTLWAHHPLSTRPPKGA